MADREPVRAAEVRRVALLAVFALLPIYLVTATWSSLQSRDPLSAAQAGWQVAKTGDLAFDGPWPRVGFAWEAEGADGRLYSNRFPGVIGVAAIGYCAAALIGVLPDAPTALDVPVWPATLMAVLVAVLAALLTWRLFRETEVPPRFALFAAGFVALGSPLWSVSADALWTHGATHALLAAALLAVARQRTGAAALFGGLAILFRPHLAVAVLVIGAFQKDWRSRLTIWVGAFFGVVVLAGYSMWIFGQPLPAAGYPVGQVVQGMPLQSPSAFTANVVDWLFDPRRGVLIMVPAVLLAVPKLRPAWAAAPVWVRMGAVAGAAYAFAQIGLIRASGGNYFFGHRTTIEALVLASPLMVLSINEWTRDLRSPGRVLLLVVLGYSLLVHAYGAVVGVPPGLKEVLKEEQQEVREMFGYGAPGS